MTDLCHCGRPLHYTDPTIEGWVRGLVTLRGALMEVTTPEGTWLVPRHYIALHGVKAAELTESPFEKIR